MKSSLNSELKSGDNTRNMKFKEQGNTLVLAAITSCTNTSNPYVMILQV